MQNKPELSNLDYTDIQFKGALLRHAPIWARSYIILMRMDRPVGTLLLLWPCIWSIFMASGGAMNLSLHSVYVLALFALGAFLMRSAGCVINDIWDRNLDKKVARTALRPLASGALKLRHAALTLLALLAASFLILIQLHIIAVLLGFLALCLVVVYPASKRFTYWPQVVLGLTFNFGALMGWAAIDGHVSLAALCLYISGILWTLAYDTIYAYQDKEDDAFIGIKSTALLFGDTGGRWVRIFYGASMVVFILAGILGQAPALFYLVTLLSYGYILVTLKGWNMADPDNCLAIFKKNMNLGFLLALACAIS